MSQTVYSDTESSKHEVIIHTEIFSLLLINDPLQKPLKTSVFLGKDINPQYDRNIHEEPISVLHLEQTLSTGTSTGYFQLEN